MGLLLNKTGLKKDDGSILPSEDIFVKFRYFSEYEGLNQRFQLIFYIDHDSKTNGYSTINILNGDDSLSGNFTKTLTLQEIENYETSVTSLMPNSSCFEKTLFTYHLFVKEYLESIFGEDTVVIRMDLQ